MRKGWAATLIRISVRFQSSEFKAGYKLLLWCTSCTKCVVKPGGWSAWCVYTSATRTLSRRYTPSDAHGTFDKIRKWNALTAQTEHALKRHMAANLHVWTQDLLTIVEKEQPGQPVDEKFLQIWRKNHTVHKGPTVPRHTWRVFDWQQLFRSLPPLQSVACAAPIGIGSRLVGLDPACYSGCPSSLCFACSDIAEGKQPKLSKALRRRYIPSHAGWVDFVESRWDLCFLVHILASLVCDCQQGSKADSVPCSTVPKNARGREWTWI